ncbi:MAG: TIGR03668 family PPOX class F420-dependent oxidoreductase [Geminicoccaceae bacterium]
MLTEKQQQFLEVKRVARFATASIDGQPHVIPICYGLIKNTVYFTIDEKAKKQSGMPLKRLQNLIENPKASLVVDHYEEDWNRLGWVMLQGQAEILATGDEHALAQSRLRERYPQLQAMRIEALPVVALRIDHVVSWGRLEQG